MRSNPKPVKQFLYTKPKVSHKLSTAGQIAHDMAALASQLVATERTRVIHPDGRAENVAEHSLMIGKVAPELAHAMYPQLDENLVARFSLLHDDVEAYVGDTPTDTLANLDQAAKDAREQAGLRQLVRDYAHLPGYIKLVQQYENQSIPEARFVRAVDKLMVLLIHVPNSAAVLKRHYTYESFLQSEHELMARDSYKYGEFDLIKALRSELGLELADMYLH